MARKKRDVATDRPTPPPTHTHQVTAADVQRAADGLVAVVKTFVPAARKPGSYWSTTSLSSVTTSRSAQHGLGSAEPWVIGFSSPFSLIKGVATFHPNAAGMRAVADAIVESLK